jgi:hypothetical protein
MVGDGGMSTAIDRALARRRSRIRLEPDSGVDFNRERLVGLGSVVLGRLREDCDGGALEAFRLYSGLVEDVEILIQSCRIGAEPEGGRCSFSLTEDARLICESTMMGPDGYVTERIELEFPEDFLGINHRAVEALYEDLMKEGFWDRVAFKHTRVGKPGYEDIWGERA